MSARKLSAGKQIAYIAVMCALLIGMQLAFSAIRGVEIVTVLLLCFCYCLGVKCGVICAVCFSLLRCLIFGFYPTVILLYLIYFPLFALIFGALGKIKNEFYSNPSIWVLVAINLALIALIILCSCANICDLIKISKLYKNITATLLWVLVGLFLSLLISYDVCFILNRKNNISTYKALRLIFITAVAALCTVCFTMLDNIITPLTYGYTKNAALGYFYASFTALLPQGVCTVISVLVLFYPVCAVMKKL